MNIKWKTMLLITAGAAIAGCSQTSNSSQEVSLTQPPSEAVQEVPEHQPATNIEAQGQVGGGISVSIDLDDEDDDSTAQVYNAARF